MRTATRRDTVVFPHPLLPEIAMRRSAVRGVTPASSLDIAELLPDLFQGILDGNHRPVDLQGHALGADGVDLSPELLAHEVQLFPLGARAAEGVIEALEVRLHPLHFLVDVRTHELDRRL